ncbi:MAG: hypothetical protein Q9M19_06580, partial [Mariprofundaceae bacterium]|nr:hypothetical protein [Mariprofundaceae bacterium]
MKKILLTIASLAVAAVASVSVAPTNSEAVPAFARQTGAACLNCHFQAIPRLAAMGREFRANGFVDTSADLIEDDHLSLPVAFGASLLFKARMGSKTVVGKTPAQVNLWESGTDSAFQYPDEAALLMGGRVAEHTGALAEWSGGPLSYKLIQTIEAGDGVVGLVIASTDALGTAYAFNNPSNALIRNTRGSQFRPGFLANSSIQQGVSGYGAYFSSDMIHIGVAQFINNTEADANIQNGAGPGMELGQGLASFDASWKGDLAGFDTVATVYSVSGTQTHNGVDYSEASNGVALQMQGEVAGALVGLYAVVGNSDVAGDGYNLLATYSVSGSTLVKAGFSSTVTPAVDAIAFIADVAGTATTATTAATPGTLGNVASV